MTSTTNSASEGLSGLQPVRLAAWASLALLSGVSAYYLYQHPIQVARGEVVAAADPMKQVQQVAQQQTSAAMRDILIEVRRLSAAVGTLNTDRDRLYSRLNAIEQNIDSITGSLARQGAITPAGPVPSSPSIATMPSMPLDQPGPTSTDTSTADGSVAAVALPTARTSFGIDLGTAANVDGLRAIWRKEISASSALANLQPIVAVKERPGTTIVSLRLLAGPVSDAAAAARLCESLSAGSQRSCEPSVYEGQRLALDVAPPAVPRKKPSPLRLPSAPKQQSNTPPTFPR